MLRKGFEKVYCFMFRKEIYFSVKSFKNVKIVNSMKKGIAITYNSTLKDNRPSNLAMAHGTE